MSEPGHARDRPRRSECDRQDDRDAQHHKEEIAEPHLARVLPLHPQEVAHRRKVDRLTGAASQEMQQERHPRRRREEERPGREETHDRRCRAANARRRGTPNGWLVFIGS